MCNLANPRTVTCSTLHRLQYALRHSSYRKGGVRTPWTPPLNPPLLRLLPTKGSPLVHTVLPTKGSPLVHTVLPTKGSPLVHTVLLHAGAVSAPVCAPEVWGGVVPICSGPLLSHQGTRHCHDWYCTPGLCASQRCE